MRTKTAVATLAVLAIVTGTPAFAQTTVGVAVGATVSTGILGGPLEPDVAVSGWVTRPISGPVEWRAEFTRGSMAVPEVFEVMCGFGGLLCQANLSVTTLGGGLQFEPWARARVAPYGYVTVGWHHVGGAAEVGYSARGRFPMSGSWNGKPIGAAAWATGTATGTLLLSGSWNEDAAGAALAAGMRVKLDDRWAIRAELRYSGFAFGGGDVGWTSFLTPSLNVSVRF